MSTEPNNKRISARRALEVLRDIADDDSGDEFSDLEEADIISEDDESASSSDDSDSNSEVCDDDIDSMEEEEQHEVAEEENEQASQEQVVQTQKRGRPRKVNNVPRREPQVRQARVNQVQQNEDDDGVDRTSKDKIPWAPLQIGSETGKNLNSYFL